MALQALRRIPRDTQEVVVAFVQDTVEASARVRTDGSPAYQPLEDCGYIHEPKVMLGSKIPAHAAMPACIGSPLCSSDGYWVPTMARYSQRSWITTSTSSFFASIGACPARGGCSFTDYLSKPSDLARSPTQMSSRTARDRQSPSETPSTHKRKAPSTLVLGGLAVIGWASIAARAAAETAVLRGSVPSAAQCDRHAGQARRC